MTWSHPHEVARRAAVARRIAAGVVGVLLIWFFRLQVLSGNRYRLLSEHNRLRAIPVPAPRGLIFDRNGVVLAENVPGYSVALLSSSTDSLAAVLGRMRPILDLDTTTIRAVLRRYRRRPYDPVMVERDVPFAEVAALQERRVILPGLVIQTEPKRRYPFGAIAAHVTGYVSEITEQELANGTIQDARPGALVGRDGLEREYDNRLRGKDGVRFVEVDALGRTVREHGVAGNLAPEQGASIHTSLDIGLQRYVAQAFPPNKRGAVVALDPRTGEILAMYSSPSYDPNVFIGGVAPAVWEALSHSPAHPLLNRAIQAAYPPASPWKLLVAALALRRGIVTLNSHMPIPCRGGIQYYNRYFRCWKVDGHGDLNLAQAIQYSCDVYFYQLGLKLGLKNLLSGAQALGMSDSDAVDLPGERSSFFPASTSYFDRRYGPRGWTNAVTLNLAIGQGENTQTPLNMAHFYAMLASPGGTSPRPHLVGPPVPSGESLGLDSTQLQGLRDALVAVVEAGTAVRARIEDLKIAGKTGTAQNPHGPDHGWFVAFAPADHPKIVVAAIIEFAEHGGRVAPMVSSIIARYLLGPGGAPAPNQYRLVVPEDSAPRPVPILPDTSHVTLPGNR